MITNKQSTAIDTNIIIYAFDENLSSPKRLVALDVITATPVLSSQVLSEIVNILHKRWKYSKAKLIETVNFLIQNCVLFPVNNHIVLLSHKLILKYDFQYFDALIVASAITSNCSVLYSEDMQHNMLVENRLSIINPFL